MLTQDNLKQLLQYNPLTGDFIWLKSRLFKGKKAGYISSDGYLLIGIENKKYAAHRLAWLYMTGELPMTTLDHIDTIKHNNKWNNLRKATISQNSCNTKLYSNNTSGVKGIVWNKRNAKWAVQITIHKKSTFGGYFKNLDEAILAIQNLREILHKEFARHI